MPASFSLRDITHGDKIFWPGLKLTKGDLARYYDTIADVMLPYLKDRPLSLLRQPDGINGEAFFQKDIAAVAPKWAKSYKVHSESTGEDVHYLVAESKADLLYMVQLGCIEINPWSSRYQRPSKPDWLALDLDPEAASFASVVKTAQTIHDLLEELEITSYPKTSGKSGMHIYIPLAAEYSYKQAKDFAHLLAQCANARASDITSLERKPSQRQGKVYIDYLQNNEGQTLAAPYSARPTPTAAVSAPLEWREVTAKLSPSDFTITNLQTRLDKKGDLFRGVLGAGINIKKLLPRLECLA